MAASNSGSCCSDTKQQQHRSSEQNAQPASFLQFSTLGPAHYFRSVLLLLMRSTDCARGALRSSGLGKSIRPRRPYTAPLPPSLLLLLLLLLLSQCCGIDMIHELSCCRARSSSRGVRARVRGVISERRIVHDTKWEQSVP